MYPTVCVCVFSYLPLPGGSASEEEKLVLVESELLGEGAFSRVCKVAGVGLTNCRLSCAV